MPIPRPYCCERCEDAAFLLDRGADPAEVATRVGATLVALEGSLRRHGHTRYAGALDVAIGHTTSTTTDTTTRSTA